MRWDLTTWKEKEEDIGWDNIRLDLFEARRKEMREALIKTRSLDLRWDKRPTGMTSNGFLLIFIISQCHYITWHENGKKNCMTPRDMNGWRSWCAQSGGWGCPGEAWTSSCFSGSPDSPDNWFLVSLGGSQGFQPCLWFSSVCLLANLSGSQKDVVQSTVPLPWYRDACLSRWFVLLACHLISQDIRSFRHETSWQMSSSFKYDINDFNIFHDGAVLLMSEEGTLWQKRAKGFACATQGREFWKEQFPMASLTACRFL